MKAGEPSEPSRKTRTTTGVKPNLTPSSATVIPKKIWDRTTIVPRKVKFS